MKKGSFIGLVSILLYCSCQKSSSNDPAPVTNSDSATVTVVNGYGSGKYKIGDTVHIWANPTSDSYVFDQWTGYSSLLQNSGEWHNEFIMPSQNVTVTGNQKAITPFTLKYEKIKGVSISKNVYYYFPTTQKGVAFLLHGSGGNALNLVTNYEWLQMIKDLVTAGYAIIVTEAEEASLNKDVNGNGSIQWNTTPVDSTTNVDLGNIKALRDTFYARGYTNASVPLYSIGMSNGGAFSCILSYVFKFKSGVSYCAQAYKAIFNVSTVPYQFCMAKNDDQPEVGATGNADALTNSQGLNSRGVCSKYFITDRSPVYPERFARLSDISVATSTAIFKELKNNNWLTDKNFMKANSDSVSKVCLANTATYPTYNSLNAVLRYFVNMEIDVMFAGHQFYSDFDKTTIKFLDSRCQ
ncbi:hypothetical protein A3860_32760 [Niastella vici]|uniref:Bacterial repeat domain-containing protein n=1 Tax=Niastella vici TaxID=1703345 RepID=A0A1V9FQI8_9BACT|nr:hypothetical protein [Niastella vici]OQP60588.1 hypothetical protein A3860_32760 [Niastella vici]